jgi:hypothetical protein
VLPRFGGGGTSLSQPAKPAATRKIRTRRALMEVGLIKDGEEKSKGKLYDQRWDCVE